MWGEIAGFASGLTDSLFGGSSLQAVYDPWAAQENKWNRQFTGQQNALSYSRTRAERLQAQKFAARQFQRQVTLHKNAITDRVRDARRAGIHPLYALGAASPGISPTSAAFTGVSGAGAPGSLAPAQFATAGQDSLLSGILNGLSKSDQVKAQRKAMERAERMDELQIRAMEFEIERNWAEAQALRASAQRDLNSSGFGRLVDEKNFETVAEAAKAPSRVEVKPVEVKQGRKGQPHIGDQEPAFVTVVMPDGQELKVPGDALSQATEDLVPALITGLANKAYLKAKGKKWLRDTLDPIGPRSSYSWGQWKERNR